MKHTIKFYPYLYLSLDGKLSHVSGSAYSGTDVISLEYSSITHYLPLMEIEVEIPNEAEIRAKALEILRANRTKLRAEHTAILTKLQFVENQLLGLPAPDLVEGERRPYHSAGAEDATVKPSQEEGEDDGSPF